MSENKKVITDAARDFIHKNKTSDRQKGINPANHNTETKRYAKLSLSLTKAEKEKIEAYRDKHFPRTSISTIIINLLEKEGYFK